MKSFYIYIVGLIILAAIVLFSLITGVKFSLISDDMLDHVDGPLYTGLLSNTGIVLWLYTASICFFTHLVLRHKAKDDLLKSFFMASAVLSFVLAMDDFWMIHEGFNQYIPGVHEEMIYLVYLFIIAAYFLYYKSFLKNIPKFHLGLALVFFAVSLGSDIVLDVDEGGIKGRFLLENGSKFLGILGWSAFFTNTAVSQIITINKST